MGKDEKVINSSGQNIKRFIFLDIDGVMAGYKYLIKGKGFIDPDKVKLLNQLKGSKIVISSSWGEDADKPLRDLGLELPIIGHTQHISLNYEYLCRGNEIEKWLHDAFGYIATKYGNKYRDNEYEYVILDDDEDMLLGQKNNFIKINRNKGITQKDIDKAKKILKIYE